MIGSAQSPPSAGGFSVGQQQPLEVQLYFASWVLYFTFGCLWEGTQSCFPSAPKPRKNFGKARGFTALFVNSASKTQLMLVLNYWLLLGTTSSCQLEKNGSTTVKSLNFYKQLAIWYVKTDCSQTMCSADITAVAKLERVPSWPLFCPTEI